MKSKLLKITIVSVLVMSLFVVMIGCAPQETSEEPAAEEPAAEEPAAEEPAEEPAAEEPAAEEPAAEEITLGLAMHGLSSEFGRVLADAEVAACEAAGYKYELMDPDFDVNTQINQVETLITNKVDGILITPVDAEACAPAIEKIHDAGIPCVVVNMLANTDKYNAYVGSNDVSVGEDILNWIADKIGGEGKIVIMEGIYGFAAQIQRLEGIESALEAYPDIEVLAMETANWSRAEGMTLMENWLNTFEGEIDAIIGENDEMAIGAMQAVIAQNPDKKIWIAGIDGLEDAKNGIKDGTYDCTFFQNAEAQATGGVDVMTKILNDESYDKETWIPFEEINADNIDNYM